MKAIPAIIAALAAAPLALAPLGATAEEAANPDAAIKYRKNVMKQIGGSVSAIASVLKGEAGRKEDLPLLLAALEASSDPAMVKAAFQPTTEGGSEKTTATGDIWSSWDEFAAIADKLGAAAKVAAAKGADVGFGEMKPVFAECKACHDDYREK